MSYKQIRFLVLAMGLSVVTQALAQASLDDPAVARTIRVKYVQTADLPDGIAYHTLVSNLSEMNKVDRESAIGLVREHMHLSRFEAENFLDRLLEDSHSIKNEHDRITQDVACNPKSQILSRDEIYPAFEALDDAWEPLGTRHLASKKLEIGQAGANRLQEWLNLKKRSIAYVKFRQKEHWEYTKGDPNEALSAICRGLTVSDGGLSK